MRMIIQFKCNDTGYSSFRNATCMRVRGNAGSFVAGVLKHLTKCVLCSMSNVVNSVTEHDVKAALRANAGRNRTLFVIMKGFP